MGQIANEKSVINRANAMKFSDTSASGFANYVPASGEIILISSDNSMTANGQGNFDFFVVGDGSKKANMLEVKPIHKVSLYKKIPKEQILVNTGYITSASGIVNSVVTNFSCSDYIPVQEGDRLLYTGFSGNNGVAGIYGYKQDKTSYGTLLVGDTKKRVCEEIIVPSGVAFIRISAGNTTHTNYMPTTSVYVFQDVSLDRLLNIEDEVLVLNDEFTVANTEILALNELVSFRGSFVQYPISVDAKIIKRSTITGNTSNPWYTFRSSAEWNNDKEAWKITVDNKVFGGLRSDNLWTTLNSIQAIDFTKTIYILIDVYVETTGLRLWEFNVASTSTSEMFYKELKQGWNNNIVIEIPANHFSSISDVSRMQFWIESGNNYGQYYTGTWYIRNFAFSQQREQNNIQSRLDKLENTIETNYFSGKKLAIIGDSISTSGRFKNYLTKILSTDVGNSMGIYITYFDVYDSDTTTLRNQTIGGVTLTPSMIGTLQTFTPVAGDVGKEFGVNYVYNGSRSLVTWSEIVADALEMQIVGNAQYSGASMCSGQTGVYVGTAGCSDYTVAACSERDDNGNAVNPDVILIYRGVNDLSHGQGGTGYSHIEDYDITENGYPNTDFDGSHYQFRRAYYLCIKKLREAYPNALIFCCTLNVFKRITYDRFPTRNGLYSLPEINAVIRDIADVMGCGLIELDKDGVTFENCYPTYISDSAVTPTHPNQTGHLQMAKKGVADMRAYIKEIVM